MPEIKNWNIPDEKGTISVPDELDPLLNKIGFQVKLHKISRRTTENEMVCNILFAAQKFFSENKHLLP